MPQRTAADRRCSPRFICLLPLATSAGMSGCEDILPKNIGIERTPERETLLETSGTTFCNEPDFPGAVWLEFDRLRESGRTGGYLLRKGTHRGALILVLHGATTFFLDGPVYAARGAHNELAEFYGFHGYLTWTLTRRQCTSGYGEEDLADVLEALDWLDRIGKSLLNVDRVYLVGYSTGGTLTVLANRRRDFEAGAVISGLTSLDQFRWFRDLYVILASMFPSNVGICHLRATLESYFPPGSASWDAFDSVANLDEHRNPLVFFHGDRDVVLLVENMLNLQAEYERRIAAGADLPHFEFILMPGNDHFQPYLDPAVHEYALLSFEGLEPDKPEYRDVALPFMHAHASPAETQGGDQD